ncbi:ThiF family adenylyltransferase [Kutzneria kofuensis]|uniref:Integrative and conjugative element protein (TIGR02256 family) n=1 Tax=Kutzneria kofuensis TaxID=103725 RepID=A0A7W9KRI9_9PSEU|nr:ThiF family adenylyltransferase [Kutzneria kofuensis]MBB5896689.1 integrative and conjugative element protein (TIGR02256 family) [Kutzneria kofuensis]
MSTTEPLTDGQHRALDELRYLERVAGGRVKVEAATDDGRIDITIYCGSDRSKDADAQLQAWEPFSILVGRRYPLEVPAVQVRHRRFAGLPHVVWGEYLCLHVGDNDWDPGRGMQGLLERLLAWLDHVATGTLTGPDLPWEPPIARAIPQLGRLIIRPELPDALVTTGEPHIALAVVTAVGDRKYELRQWLTGPDDLQSTLDPPNFLAVGVILQRPADYSYPTRRAELLASLRDHGFSLGMMQELTDLALVGNVKLWEGVPLSLETWPLPFLLVISPSPGHAGPRHPAAHVAAWYTDPLKQGDELLWLKVYDRRPSIVTRRDHSRPAHWLTGQRILVLGCGALGAPVAESCVRAGAEFVECVDNRAVHPGILVRQPYRYDDIGHAKATVLAERLRGITPEATVEGTISNAIDLVADDGFLAQFDLVVDATANRSVAVGLERTRWTMSDRRPPVLSVMVGHDCERAIGTLALPSATGGGVDALRRLALAAGEDDGWQDVLDDFFPDPPRTELFQPEPGCSDPTFVGSAMDMSAFAGQLLNDALAQLATPVPVNKLVPALSATVLRSTEAVGSGPAVRRRQWRGDMLLTEAGHRFQVRVDPAASAGIRAEIERVAEFKDLDCETGGYLLGQIDQASRVVWITEAPPPPPGSEATATSVKLIPDFVRQVVAERRARTRGLVDWVGTWHTHPHSEPNPSSLDVSTAAGLAEERGALLLLIVGGGPGRLTAWTEHRQQPDFHTRLFLPS